MLAGTGHEKARSAANMQHLIQTRALRFSAMNQKPKNRIVLAIGLGIVQLWRLLSGKLRKTLIRQDCRWGLQMAQQDGHDSRAVANEILRQAREVGRALTPMQVIKLVYFAHGWTLALLRKPLIRHQVEAWQYGPVVREVYWALGSYGKQPIAASIKDQFGQPYRAGLSPDERAVLRSVVKNYSHLHAYELSDLTHLPGTPWSEARKNDTRRQLITDASIQEYFSRGLGASNHGRGTTEAHRQLR
jgi:uncharacterized phage-associated protein